MRAAGASWESSSNKRTKPTHEKQPPYDIIQAHSHRRDEDGHRQVVCNGHLPQRSIQTGLGDIQIQQLGENVAGLSPANIVRLKKQWERA